MPVVINELEVVARPQAPAPVTPATAGGTPPDRPTDADIADVAERAWRRVAELGERVRGD